MMFGTIGRVRIKPGMEEQLLVLGLGIEKDPGEVATYVYRMDAEPGILYMVAIFESKEAYMANADRPEADARYQQMHAYFDGEPEWHDGEIVFSLT